MVQAGPVSLWVSVGVPLAVSLVGAVGNWVYYRRKGRAEETAAGVSVSAEERERLQMLWGRLDQAEARQRALSQELEAAERRAREAEARAGAAEQRAAAAEAETRVLQEAQRVMEGRYFRLRRSYVTLLGIIQIRSQGQDRPTDPRLPDLERELEAIDRELEDTLNPEHPAPKGAPRARHEPEEG